MAENENLSDAVKEVENIVDTAEGATSELVTPPEQPQSAGPRPNPFDNMQNAGPRPNPFDNMQNAGTGSSSLDSMKNAVAQNAGIPSMAGQQNPYMNGANPYTGQKNPFDNMQGQNPYTPSENPYLQNPSGDPEGGKPAKKKMSKGKKIGLISGIVVFVAALAVCGFIFIPKLFKPKKETIKKAVFQARDNFVQGNMFSTEFGADQFGKSLAKNGGKIVVKAKNPNDSSEYIDFEADIDSANKEASFVASGNADKLDGTARGYINTEKAYITVDDEMTGYYYVDLATAVSEYANSYISSIGSNSSYYYNNSFLDYFGGSAAISPEQLQQLKDVIKQLIDKVDYSKDGSKKLTLGGKSYDTTKYVLTIPKKELQNTVSDLLDVVLASGAIGGSNGEYYGAMLSSYISTIFNKDIKINLYVYDDAVIAMDTGYEIDVLGQKASIGVNAQFDGEGDLYSAFNGSIKLETADSSMEIAVDYDSYDIENGTECVFGIKVIRDGDIDSQVDWILSYNRVTADIVFSMQGNQHEIEESLYGKVLSLEKGKKIEIQFDTMYFKNGGYYGTGPKERTETIDLFVGLYSDFVVEKVPSNVTLVNLLTSSESEFKSILSQKLIDYIDELNKPEVVYEEWEIDRETDTTEDTTEVVTEEATSTTTEAATTTTTEASTEATTEK